MAEHVVPSVEGIITADQVQRGASAQKKKGLKVTERKIMMDEIIEALEKGNVRQLCNSDN